MELLTSQELRKFNDKIKDIYNVNIFVTALQWIGCVLGSLVIVGGYFSGTKLDIGFFIRK